MTKFYSIYSLLTIWIFLAPTKVCFTQMPTNSDSLQKIFNRDTTNLEVLSLLAQSYEPTDPNKAKECARKILQKKKGTQFDLIARAYNTMGNCALIDGDLDEAEKNYLLAIESIKNYKNNDGSSIWFVATYQNSLAQVYLNKGQLKDAVFMYQDALEVLKNAKYHKELDFHIATSLGGLGDAYNQLGLYELALNNLFESLKINELINDPISIGINYNSIAAIYDNLEEYEKSRKFNLLALEYFEKADYPLANATVLLNLAQSEFKTKNLNQAIDYLKKSEKILNEIGTTYNLGDVKLLFGEIEQENKRYDLALKYFDEARSLFDEMENLYGSGRAYYQKGVSCHSLKKHKESYEYFEKALEIFSQSEFLKDKKLTLEKLIDISLEYRDFDRVETYFNALKNVEKEFLNEERIKAIAAQEVLFETEKKEKQIAEQALELEQEKNAKLYASFGAIVLLFLLIAVWLGFRQQNKKRSLEILNSLMTMQKNIVEKELEQLNKQLDPHEIKNMLASISPEIQDKAPDAYRKMLKLLNIVKSSLSGKITQELNEQIQQIRDFLTLEQTHFTEPFEFEVDVNLNHEMLKIPRLLLKNLVENSVKHGMRALRGKGKILVSVSEANDVIHIVVRDNGVGRKQAIMNDSGIGTVTYKRLFEVLNMRNDRKASFEIIDLEQGTQVEVKIPLDYNYE